MMGAAERPHPRQFMGFIVNGYKKLKVLILAETRVSDAGLKALTKMPLEFLVLRSTRVTDAGMKDLAALNQLKWLELDKTRVTDAGLKNLSGLNKLEHLVLYDTPVTDAGVRRLQKALPDCYIHRLGPIQPPLPTFR
jgi:hypothetical protein